ncbi:hypothetical protein Y88_0472 [Novosphingobium nitrogenifigens DSM 19370]|jgi:hypothetical protein|uniref:Uncharacterized protein n=1 Tax=Novosphingobium nitrogenifigens DSM 19370 TaxID=983920 RepID=F1ZAH4_9SPHN|nr:hypothetical protein [Novosphingobium nitrogenifigens]EGD58417.1 hypothetical protein Y88_0472 [Novosphingobium nitrogenifigens DSM 19370]
MTGGSQGVVSAGPDAGEWGSTGRIGALVIICASQCMGEAPGL